MSLYHIPVLLHETISALEVKPGGVYVDATFGGGGHSRAILERLSPKGRLIVMDQDSDALTNVPQDDRVLPAHANFRFIHNFVRYHGFERVDGILADLGVSSHQFDTGERGFSFRFDAELDMRMNPQAGLSAKEIVNSYPAADLERLFRDYGEIPNAGSVASLICRFRGETPIETTGQLCEAIAKATPNFAEHKFLAKVFQALRIEVNSEMTALEKFIPMAVRSLAPGGVLAVITYHSLEDRIVKNAIRDAQTEGLVKKVNSKPILPGEQEISDNTRARSAKLRVARKNGEEKR